MGNNTSEVDCSWNHSPGHIQAGDLAVQFVKNPCGMSSLETYMDIFLAMLIARGLNSVLLAQLPYTKTLKCTPTGAAAMIW
jgi:hypothetical protein